MKPTAARLAVLLLVLAPLRAEEGDAGARASRSFTFVYRAAVVDVPADAERVRLWVPVPRDNRDQEIGAVTVTVRVGGAEESVPLAEAGALTRVGDAAVTCTGAPVRNGDGYSLCVETKGRPVAIEVASEVTRYETGGGGSASPEALERAKRPDKMIPLDGKAAANAKQIESGDDALETARNLYDHTLERMRYDKPAGGAWGRGDAEWACDARFGNCTDFHSYFMALARTKGIPARFEMGFPVPGGDEKEAEIGGYHCWAFFWANGHGWVPVDISEADKHPEKTDYFFGTLDHDRVTMTSGRDLTLEPAPAVGTLNFFVYPHAEVDGKPHPHVEKSFKRILP